MPGDDVCRGMEAARREATGELLAMAGGDPAVIARLAGERDLRRTATPQPAEIGHMRARPAWLSCGC